MVILTVFKQGKLVLLLTSDICNVSVSVFLFGISRSLQTSA